jgi:hypothetical protein
MIYNIPKKYTFGAQIVHLTHMPVEKENFRLGKYKFQFDLQCCSWKSLESLGQGIS